MKVKLTYTHSKKFYWGLAVLVCLCLPQIVTTGSSIPIDPDNSTDTIVQSRELLTPDRRLAEVPAENVYGGIWDEEEIHPYHFPVDDFTDIIKIRLIDTLECPFELPVTGDKTSNFGWRRHRFHYGVDIDLYTGDTVRTVFDGVVRYAKYSQSYGNLVIVRHFNGLETFYAHLSRIKVKPGDAVTSGQYLGLGGRTGRATGSHLHFEVRYKGWAIDPDILISFDDKLLMKNEFYFISGGYKRLKTTTPVRFHVVKEGETLGALLSTYHLSAEQLLQYNAIEEEMLMEPGRQLRIR